METWNRTQTFLQTGGPLGQDNISSFLGLLVFAFSSVFFSTQDKCSSISDLDKIDCGHVGSSETSCLASGCCWKPISPNPSNFPWCFKDRSAEDSCKMFNWSAAGPGFDDAMYEVLYKNFLNQLNVEGVGAVVAAPDQNTPGGSYYYHWMRDAGLSIKAWMDINDNDYAKVNVEVGKYSEWVEMVQHMPANTVDVRVEPKFEIPSGKPFKGPWGRPQTDGPALRAMALSQWGMILSKAGQGDPEHIWSLIQFDLAWVKDNWKSEGFDLWEEVKSTDFYFNRMAYVYSLNVAADFGDMIGKTEAAEYRALAETIRITAATHWRARKGYIYQSTNRLLDGAVIHSIATFGEFLYPPESEEAAATVNLLTKKFCKEYLINQKDNKAGVPGILIGRYPGDTYAGGNPWQLLTAVTAEFFYLGGKATLKKIRDIGNFTLNNEQDKEWLNLLDLEASIPADHFALAQIEAGDAVMTRLYLKVKADGGRIDEQIDRNTGLQTSASSLTWSYANILQALHIRQNLLSLRKEVLGF